MCHNDGVLNPLSYKILHVSAHSAKVLSDCLRIGQQAVIQFSAPRKRIAVFIKPTASLVLCGSEVHFPKRSCRGHGPPQGLPYDPGGLGRTQKVRTVNVVDADVDLVLQPKCDLSGLLASQRCQRCVRPSTGKPVHMMLRLTMLHDNQVFACLASATDRIPQGDRTAQTSGVLPDRRSQTDRRFSATPALLARISARLTMSSAAAPNHQREANLGDRPFYEPKTHLS